MAAALLLAMAATHPTSGSLLTPIASLAQADAVLKLDRLTQGELLDVSGSSRVIVRAADGVVPSSLTTLIESAGGSVYRTLGVINAQAATIPNTALSIVAASPLVARISADRAAAGAMERTGATVRATAVRQELGYDGTGIGVATIDSGVTTSHDDLVAPSGAQRVVDFVDLVNGAAVPYDDYGHGTHVAGIVAGNGFDSGGARTGIAPGAHLVVIKALDSSGRGYISDVIAALDYVVTHKDVFNIRVVNLSVATGVYESYNTDPLTLSARQVVEEGIVVVTAAGNRGRNPNGRDAYGGVTAPGNAPWVLTVGASSHMGTVKRSDDTMAAFSSRGPGAVDYGAKPDLIAPGVGIESLSDPSSAFYTTRSSYLLPGTVATWYLPYLSLSGTSMAAPVVSGTVALMLQANPALTPNLVKAILEFTAQVYPSYDPLTEGAGFLNAKGAVDLARYFVAPQTIEYPSSSGWSKGFIWGNRLVSRNRLPPGALWWSTGVTWGDSTVLSDPSARNVVWGTACGGADCDRTWTVEGASADDSVVWGTSDGDSVVWGTSDDSVVWGTSCEDASCEPAMWPHP
jgi:serine protease AprX